MLYLIGYEIIHYDENLLTARCHASALNWAMLLRVTKDGWFLLIRGVRRSFQDDYGSYC